MQLALERIGDIPIDAVQVYTDGSRDDYYRSGSGIYIKSQDHFLRIQRRNPDGCSVFRSELRAIDEAFGSLTSLPNGKDIWYCLIVEMQYSTCPIGKVTKHQNKSNWIIPPEHHWYECSRPRGSMAHSFTRQIQTLLARFRSAHLKTMKFSEGCKSFKMCTNCSSEPTSPAHILECLGLTKQDLADDPMLVLDFADQWGRATTFRFVLYENFNCYRIVSQKL
ncbi:RNase H domain-containing protein [Trichonephila clavipes]|nr:RNase H domain-containing protein [Trichonephila clavipes]